jgi:hypothetical protein
MEGGLFFMLNRVEISDCVSFGNCFKTVSGQMRRNGILLQVVMDCMLSCLVTLC